MRTTATSGSYVARDRSPTPTDAAIVAGLANRDEAALVALVEACGRVVYARALQILVDPQLAEEVAQDVLLILWWAPERFDPSKGTLRSFLVSVARFKAIDRVRKEERERSRQSLLVESAGFFEAPAETRADDAIDVRSAISQLPPAKREVIFLAYYKGFTYSEVARVLDLPEGTVKTRIRDSLLRLKIALAGTGTA